ncbi:hypothetical protein [Paraburkholderia sp. J67]|uniref:hypothetical protein n=1 Tax=Paraburkholderia sp. J67 TaxID=2805435 RepID=UPI002ABD865E|nr:hypothetical protein [Paraburkholderia sp. J67]
MSNPVAFRFWGLFKRESAFAPDHVEFDDEHPSADGQAERAALYARYGYFNLSFTPLLFPFVPEIPLE